jgi:type IX secretion system PorP/SprF family membrane protein
MKRRLSIPGIRICAFLLFSVVASAEMNAQDLHYSQFYLNPMHLSPATTGVFKGDIRATALYRSQWQQVPVAYKTFSAAVEWKALERQNNQFSLGLMLQNDEAGDAGLSWLQLGATLGVARALNANHAISAGFGIALAQRSFDIGGLTFKNQWGGDTFNPKLPSGESFNRSSGLAPTLSAGLLWHFQQTDTRSQIVLGAGLSHLNEPIVSLGDFDERLARRISFLINAKWQINSLYDLVIVGSGQQMVQAEEWLFGAGIRRILTTGLANETTLQVCLSHRFQDAFIPAIQLERNNWTLGLSYDWNTSPFESATNGRGGIEIAVIWRRIPVPALKNVKSCPVF